jgi:hypothetical protein
MHGRISIVLAGVALALGGGVAGATLVAGPAPQEAPTAAASLAADSQKLARANAQHALRAAQRARRIARRARAKANEGLATANSLLAKVDEALADSASALAAAQQAQNDASAALTRADTANTRLDEARIVEASASARVTSTSMGDYEPLPGGPQVTVAVPSSGYIEVWAEATIGDENDPAVAPDGAVGLYEDGQRVPLPGQESTCSQANFDDALFSLQAPSGTEQHMATPPVPVFGLGCGATGAPGPILLQRPPGQHTYELRYGQCGCAIDPTAFSDRVLRIGPRL